jgi:hypothetical protein
MQWPLALGKSWTFSDTDAGVSIFGKGIIDAYELVTVPAGTFVAFRTTIHVCAAEKSKGGCGDSWMWIAPQVRNVVKWAWSTEPFWAQAQLRGVSMVLKSYSLSSP